MLVGDPPHSIPLAARSGNSEDGCGNHSQPSSGLQGGRRIFATLASIKDGFGNLALTPEIQAEFVAEAPARRHWSVKLMVTFISTSTGSPLRRVGSNCHRFTASIAA